MAQIRLEFYVQQQHVHFFTEDEFADFVARNFRNEGLNPNNLDEVYNRLDTEDYKATEALIDLATDGNWCDTSRAEIADIHRDRDEESA